MTASAMLFAILDGFIKIIGPSFRAWDIAFYRFGCGLVILIAMFGWRGNLFKGHSWPLLITRGITGCIAFLTLITAIQGFRYCKSWEGGLYLMTEVIFTSLLGILFLSEIVTWRFWMGGVLIFGSAVGLNHIRAKNE